MHDGSTTASFVAAKNGVASTIATVTQNYNSGNGPFGGVAQMYSNGMYMMYTNNNAGTSEIKFYDGSTTSSAVTLPSSVTGGGTHYVNYQAGVRRIYNF
jgi:hypothetical protein